MTAQKLRQMGLLQDPRMIDKAETLMRVLYMYERLTTDQLRGLTNVGECNTVTRILGRTGYTGRRHSSGMVLYRRGRWQQIHRVNVYLLNMLGVVDTEKKLGIKGWGYTEIGAAHAPNNLERALQMADAMVAAVKGGGEDLEWQSVRYWLGTHHVWGPETESDSQETRHLRQLKDHRLTSSGFVKRQSGRDLCVGLYVKSSRGHVNYVKRAFPESLLNVVDPVLLLGQQSYERFFPMAMEYLYAKYGSMMILPYEYSVDHPTWLNSALHGNNAALLQPLFSRMQLEGWEYINKLHHPQIPFRWSASKGERTIQIDTTYGTSLAQIASIVTMPSSVIGRDVRRIVYVVSEKEKQTLESWRSVRANYAPMEFRVIDW